MSAPCLSFLPPHFAKAQIPPTGKGNWVWHRSASFFCKGQIIHISDFVLTTHAEAETPILWPLDSKNQLIGKTPDAGKDLGHEEKGPTEGKMIGRHHGLSGHEYEQTLGDGEGQGSLVCCSPWGHKESDTTECLLLLLLSRFSRVRLCATP